MLPPLPAPSNNVAWSPAVYQAYDVISEMYDRAAHVHHQEAESGRLKFHAESLTQDAVPILLALEEHAAEENIPVPWIHSLTTAVAGLIAQLCSAYETSMHRYLSIISCSYQI